MNTMNVTEHLTNDIHGVADTLVQEVLENVETLYNVRTETLEHHKDGIDEEISMELDRLRFHNVKLDIPSMPTEGLAGIVGALARELWNERVKWLLEQYNAQEPEVKISVRL